MDRSRALNTLAEASDLARMLEELMAPNQIEKLPSTVGGMRVAIRTLREMIGSSHDSLAREFINQARSRISVDDAQKSQLTQRKPEIESSMSNRPASSAQPAVQAEGAARRDLRSTIERATDR